MFERIVAIVDGSETSHYAIGASITVAREDVDELMFCVTIDPELSADGVGMTCFEQMAVQLSRRMLDEALQRAQASGVPRASGKILQDEPARGVVAFARAERAGLIIMGLAPRIGILRPFMRSLAEEILRETTIPLLAVRRPARGKLNRRILVPIVDDELSHIGVSYAIELAKNFRSSLFFCTVQDASGERAAMHALNRARADADAAGVASDELLLPRGDDICNAIVRNADVHACDSIVMATHLREGLPRLIEGSVTEAVLYASDVPVVIVRAPYPAAVRPKSRAR
jgi:nucleotide-binding universal stress UspA family protein